MKYLIMVGFVLTLFVSAIALYNAFVWIGIPSWAIFMTSGLIAFATWRYPRKVEVDEAAASATVGQRDIPIEPRTKTLLDESAEIASLRKTLGLREKLIKELQEDRNLQRQRREATEELYQRECHESERKSISPSVRALFEEHVKDAVFLVHESPDHAQSNSAFGGLPRLPDGVEWPRGARSPYHFLASVHLDELPVSVIPSDFPKSGVLYFFLDLSEGHSVDGAVLFVESEGETVTTPPDDLCGICDVLSQRGSPRALPRRSVRAIEGKTLDDGAIAALQLTSAEHELLTEMDEISIAASIKSAMDRADLMIYECRPDMIGGPEKYPLCGSGNRGHRLLRLEGGTIPELPFGDGGEVEFRILPEDCKNKRFERVWIEGSLGS